VLPPNALGRSGPTAEEGATLGPVDLVRQAFDAGNRRDLDPIVGFHAADAVWDLSDSSSRPVVCAAFARTPAQARKARVMGLRDTPPPTEEDVLLSLSGGSA
jgi:hypothetical protein